MHNYLTSDFGSVAIYEEPILHAYWHGLNDKNGKPLNVLSLRDLVQKVYGIDFFLETETLQGLDIDLSESALREYQLPKNKTIADERLARLMKSGTVMDDELLFLMMDLVNKNILPQGKYLVHP